MASETFVVEKVNQYGVRANGKQYNYSKKYEGAKLEVGQTIEAEVYTSATGAKYLNSTTVKATQIPQTTVTVTENKPVFLNGSGRDFDKEARGKSKFGLYAACLSSPYLINSADDEDFVRRADALVENFMGKIFDTK